MWAVREWHLLRARAVAAGLIGRPGAPARLLDCDPSLLLSFAESLLFDGGEENAKRLDALYRDSAPKRPVSHEEQVAAMQAALAAFTRGG